MSLNNTTDGRILHFVPDDKFIDNAILQFEACAPGIHDYAMYNRDGPSGVVYVKSLDRIRFAPVGSPLYRSLIEDCCQGRYSGVIVHSLPARFHELESAVRGYVKVAVLTWGHDIYAYINRAEYLPQTQAVQRSRLLGEKLALPKWLYRRLRQSLTTNPWLPLDRSLRALMRVDYLCPVIDEDYTLFAAKFCRHRLPEILRFSYGDIGAVAGAGACDADDSCILVNNSATAEGNHLDVLQRLKALGVLNTVVVPLNYGQPRYGSVVRERGRALFGAQFKSLDRFMSLQDYRAELRHCRYAVMGHNRQQAVGNVMIVLWMGMKLFFYTKSPVYQFLVANGMHVSAFEQASKSDFETPLGADEVAANRQVLQNIWGRDVVLDHTRQLVAAMRDGAGR